MEETSEEQILVIGLGNLLLGDEGVGVHVVRELAKIPLPSQVDVVDGGTAGLNLLDLMRGYELVVIVDAVDAGEEPGTILRLTPRELTCESDVLPLSLHQTNVSKVFELARYLGQRLPPIVIYGIQPQAMHWSTELSATLRASLPKVVDSVLNEIR